MAAVVEQRAEGRRAAPLSRQAATMADETRLPKNEAKRDEHKIGREQVEHQPRGEISSVKQRVAS